MAEFQFNQIYLQDCIQGMAQMPPQSIDLIITDPPFGIEFKAKRENYNRKAGRVLEGYNEVAGADYLDFTRAWLAQARRVLRESGSMYIFSGWNYLKDILIALDELGFITVNHLIWKYQFGLVTTRKYVTSHYHLLYVCVNDKKRKFFPYSRYEKNAKVSPKGGSLHYKDKEDVWRIDASPEDDVWEIPREYWNGDVKTPTKLPAEIIRKILAYSSEANDVVLDPFLGSGQVAVVSHLEGRQYCGFELVPEYYAFIRQRLESGSYRLKAGE